MKKRIVAITVGAAMLMGLAACGQAASSEATSQAASEAAETVSSVVEETEATVEESEAAAEAAAGFEEVPIWEDEEAIGKDGNPFLNVSGVYFQPVPMTGGNENFEDYDMHFEADVSAMENNLGFGLGDWVPYMTVSYEIIGSDGNVAAEGTFMPMSASDGPHYGQNIKLPNADTYSVHLHFDMDENTYLIHTDDETGPGGLIADVFPFDLELEDVWEYVPQEW